MPCIFTGTTTDVELDHRAGNKTHPLHATAVEPATQVAADFMPIARIINDIKQKLVRSACLTINDRTYLLFAHKMQHSGNNAASGFNLSCTSDLAAVAALSFTVL